MRKIVFSWLLIQSILANVWAAAPVIYYASPNGSGSICSLLSPGSLTSVRDKVRTVNQNMTADIIVYLRGGTYQLSSSFDLVESSTIHDSGTNGFKIIYQAYAGETPIISGGIPLTGWTLHDAGKNIYKAAIPAGAKNRHLFVNGIRAKRARGTTNPTGFTTTATGYTLPSTGLYAGMANFKNKTQIEIVGITEWKMFRGPIANISGTALTAAANFWDCAYNTNAMIGSPMWFENAYELLDTAGEFYFDEKASIDGTAKVFYKPNSAENMSTATVMACNLESLLNLTGTYNTPLHHISFSGITFSYASYLQANSTDGYATFQSGWIFVGKNKTQTQIKTNITMLSAKNISFEKNTFTHLGAAALQIGLGCQDNTISCNHFEDVSGSAIMMGDINSHHPADSRETVKNTVIKNNTILACGAEYFDNAGIFGAFTTSSSIEHNEIGNLPWAGIAHGWGWGSADPPQNGIKTPSTAQNLKVRYNYIHDIVQVTRDAAGVYTIGAHYGLSGDTFGSEISYNYILRSHHIRAGLYTDEMSKYLDLHHNVIRDVLKRYMLNNAHSNSYRDSWSDNSIDERYCPLANSAYNLCPDNIFKNNVVISNNVWPQAATDIMNAAGLEKNACAVSNPGASCSGSGTISRDQWNGIAGESVSSLTSIANYPNNPSSTGTLTSFDSPFSIADDYGARVRGYICPPSTGSYTFWIAGDNDVELWLSIDSTAANKKLIAYNIGYSAQGEWTKNASQQSAAISLTAGKKYYIEALQKESGGDDFVSVGWQLPDNSYERPVPGNRLSPWSIVLGVETINANSVQVFPNPAKDELFIHYFSEEGGTLQLTISDLLSRQLVRINKFSVAGENKTTIDTSMLKHGIYIMTIAMGNKMLTKKIMIE